DVHIFRPRKPLKFNNRLHCKFAAIDRRVVFLGGSNIGDYYTSWTDSNLRVDGDLGDSFHDLFDHLRGFSHGADEFQLDVTRLAAGDEHVHLTIPGQRSDIRRELMNLIRDARRSVFLRTWYFLPDDEMLELLCAQARRGVQVNVLLSHETR